MGGDTSGLDKALKDTNKEINSTQKELKEVERLLKLDPKNTELLAQKQELLKKQIEQTKSKVTALKDAQKNADKQIKDGVEISQSQYRKLQREIASSESSMKALKEESKKTNSTISKIGEAFSSLGSKAGATLKTVATSAAAITAAGVAGAVAMGKASVESYAEYEQLIGGVETLFGESQDKVVEYANNAYKTAGLSASEYMETATSFSASLLQSLGGDTAKAVDVADMAITDMADNANKMGTSIDLIQNAYQGFAKQNYTMLDNLKLGYGGTKTEMERLLIDAEKFSGVKYDISNLNDVYSAIHVVQEQMGITGTTAKEASKTISGSINAMKSSWSNLLIGMSDENADLEMLISNFVESIFTALDNILPRIEVFVGQLPTIISNILSKVSEYLPQILSTGAEIIQSLISGLQQNMPQIMNIIMQVMMMIVQTLISMLPNILEMGITILVELINGIAQSLPTLIPTIVECVLLIVQTLLDNIELIIEAGINILIALIQGIINALPLIIEKLPIIVQKIVDVIVNNLPLLIEASLQIIVALAEGIIKNLPELLATIPKIVESIVTGFSKLKEKITNIGKNLIEGIWNGMKNAQAWLIDKIQQLCSNALGAIKAFFGIESPSKVMRDEVGKFMAEGIGVGFNKQMPSVIEAMKEKLATVSSALNTELNFGDIPQVQGNKIISENSYVTKNYTNTIETIRQPSNIELSLNGTKFARAIIPSLNEEYTRLGAKV